MGNSFQFIDIIFFAMIAIFLILRLRGVLGKRDGNEGSGFLDLFKQDFNAMKSDNDDNANNIISLSKESTKEEALEDVKGNNVENNKTTLISEEEDSPLSIGVRQVQLYDPSFNEEDFLVGARVAFEMILKAFASADVDELRPLLSNEVYGNFAKAIQDREQEGHIMEDTLIGIIKSEAVEAYMAEKNAHITIKFISEQVNAVKDENGDVVEGNANVILKVTDFWTFARDTEKVDPNWLLVATRSLE
jgi:predicted lipid-binding transport protein (Tim44 family)